MGVKLGAEFESESTFSLGAKQKGLMANLVV